VRTALAAALLLLADASAAAPDLPAVDLAALLDEAEARSPAVRAADERHRAAALGPSVAGALPDPEIALAIENESLDRWTVGESEMSSVAAMWAQAVPSRSKRRADTEVARAEAAVRAVAVVDRRTTVRAEVKGRYVELLRVDRTRALLAERRKFLEALREVARLRYENGEGLLRDVLEAGTSVSRLELDLADLDRERAVAEAALAAALGRTELSSFGPAVDVPAVLDADAADLADAAEGSSPALLAARAQTTVEDLRVEASRWEARPEWMWAAGYAARGGLDPIVMGTVGVRLPLWADRKQHRATERARHEATAARREAEDLRARLRGGIRTQLAETDGARRKVEILEGQILPQARAVLEASEAAYRSGRLDFSTVLRDFTAVLDEQREIERLRASWLASLIAIEPITGTEIVVPAKGAIR